jgi:uncharacterized damage-inducible protein DinB
MDLMTTSLLTDAYRHHAWATLRLLDACADLTDAQLATTVPGTYGSTLETLRHLVESDTWYLHVITDQQVPTVDAEQMAVPALRELMERNSAAWERVLASDPDPDRVIVRKRDDGSETHAPLGIRLAQAIHHGTDHRSQVCTALTSLGMEPPFIDVWDFGEATGRTKEIPPTS